MFLYSNAVMYRLSKSSKYYPQSLLYTNNAPDAIYVDGNISLLNNQKYISIVGSRDPTLYGVNVIKEIFRNLDKKYTIVSGFMNGIDTFSHTLALEYGMTTIGILPSGLENPFPYKNKSLYKSMISSGLGCFVSQHESDFIPTRWSFAKRTVLVASFSPILIVIEAKINSGSILACKYALKYNKKVLVVPGSIFSNNSFGCNYLFNYSVTPLCSLSDLNNLLTNLYLSI